jgi:hypothetical protein
MKLIDPETGQAVWDSNDPNAGPVPPAPEGRQWVRVDEPGDTMAPRRTAPGILDIGNGVTERLAFLNQTFNPVEGIGSAMRAGSRMVAPDQSYWDRIASLGEMASGVASIAAPIAAAKAIGVPAASAMMEGLLGASPTSQAATDMARQFGVDESGALRLFHGSPHNFDRFSMSKIGTGEGAQAYGHGLYFAENEGIARGYRDKLAPMNTNVKMALRDAGGDYDAAIAEAQRRVSLYEAMEPSRQRDGLLAINRTKLEELLSQKAGNAPNPGLMYEVEINANPEDFIDFDAPLSDQSEKVRKVLGEGLVAAADPLQRGYRNPMYGGDLIGVDRATPEEFSQGLLDRGIAGIRYLDAGSRGMGYEIKLSNRGKPYETEPIMARSRKDAERIASEYREKGFGADIQQAGSRNYVIFDENLINIVRKYGIAGAATMLGVSAFDVEQALAENMSPSQWDQLVVGPQ